MAIVLISLIVPIFVFADGWDATKPSHAALYADTITSKTDASSVSIADSQGLFVTGNIITLGNVGIGTTSPARKLYISDAMRLQPIASPPSSPSSGDLYFDSSEALCVYVNSAWAKIAGAGTCA